MDHCLAACARASWRSLDPSAKQRPGASRTAGPAPQDNDIRFERLSLEQGLSRSVVLSILQDRAGFMWFATQDGLNRYDGYEFVVYEPNPQDPHSLNDRLVQDMVQDRSGIL